MYSTPPTLDFTSQMPVPRAEDVWDQFGTAQVTGPLVAQGLAQLPAHVVRTAAPVEEAPRRPAPLRDGLGWLLCKHLAQLTLAGAVLTFVLVGGEQPLMALCYVLTGLMLVGAMAVADRQRFLDHQPDFMILDVVRPVQESPAVTQQAMRVMVAPSSMPAHISVT
ncbi:MAG: hypothetical protein JWM25_555 [Thermoleophilia bacterium]|nr:hypothetical protein [Thermoleophilia bacterium]